MEHQKLYIRLRRISRVLLRVHLQTTCPGTGVDGSIIRPLFVLLIGGPLHPMSSLPTSASVGDGEQWCLTALAVAGRGGEDRMEEAAVGGAKMAVVTFPCPGPPPPWLCLARISPDADCSSTWDRS
jgi:hypothetical protein